MRAPVCCPLSRASAIASCRSRRRSPAVGGGLVAGDEVEHGRERRRPPRAPGRPRARARSASGPSPTRAGTAAPSTSHGSSRGSSRDVERALGERDRLVDRLALRPRRRRRGSTPSRPRSRPGTARAPSRRSGSRCTARCGGRDHLARVPGVEAGHGTPRTSIATACSGSARSAAAVRIAWPRITGPRAIAMWPASCSILAISAGSSV